MMSNYKSLLNCIKFCMVLASIIIGYSAKYSTQLELSFKSNDLSNWAIMFTEYPLILLFKTIQILS